MNNNNKPWESNPDKSSNNHSLYKYNHIFFHYTTFVSESD